MKQQQSSQITLFYSYAPQDEKLRKELEKHLSSLQRKGIITGWHDGLIQPGRNRDQDIQTHLNEASIILLLISPDFLASDYHSIREMQYALERHRRGTARVVPIILKRLV